MARTARQSRSQTTTVQKTRPITEFTRITKGLAPQTCLLKKCTEETTRPAVAELTRKRKATTLSQDAPVTPFKTVDEPAKSTKRTCIANVADGNSKQPAFRSILTVEILDRRPDELSVAPATGPRRRGRPPKPKPTESGRVAKAVSAKEKTTTLNNTRIDDFFQKTDGAKENGDWVQDLAGLHRAFLKTIAMQVTHNGSNIPIDIRTAAPDISRTWGKRQVTIEDIRRCIALEGQNPRNNASHIPSPFIVADYGHGKICVELSPKHTGGPINIVRLCEQFEDNLQAICAERATDEMADDDVDISFASLSINGLPQAPITSFASRSKSNPILAKGHRALAELKNGIEAKQQEKEAQVKEMHAMTNPDGAKMSLLDRIRMKQLAKSQLPLPPSGPELERRAALQRVEDVAAMVSMLSLSNPSPRQAFSMTVVLQKLKDSLRIPTSNEEAARCVRLLGSEIAPEWIKIVTVGGRENVVVQRGSQPVDRVIRERVQKLMV